MAEKFSRWDSADYLKTDEDMALYFEICIEEDPGDGSLIRSALGAISRARGMTQLARDTGMSRDGLYTAFSKGGEPKLCHCFEGDARARLEAAWRAAHGRIFESKA